jgi:hypothetical protein
MALIPTVLGISPGCHGCGHTLTWLVQGSVDGGLKALVLREPHLSKVAYVELARRLSPLLGSGMILHASHADALSIAEASGWGLHLPSTAPWDGVRSRVRGLLGASCHTVEDLNKAAAIGADYATLSPVSMDFKQPSHLRPCLCSPWEGSPTPVHQRSPKQTFMVSPPWAICSPPIPMRTSQQPTLQHCARS